MAHSILQRKVVVLNRNWQPIGVTNVRQALLLLFTRYPDTGEPKSRLLNLADFSTHDTSSSWAVSSRRGHEGACGRYVLTPMHKIRVPQAIVLSRFAAYPAVTERPALFARRQMFWRDGFRCAYCGVQDKEALRLTVDHVVPQSRGGSSTFQNCVTACTKCNSRKGNRTLKEAGMKLRPGVRLDTPSKEQQRQYDRRAYELQFQQLIQEQAEE